mmetsp:Transcript_16265/g.46431  ORF Transcript_16265/g.46431 Transcript_16265/m.46431 type:complete len:213 (+) Transcript_16265:811-1449(+)
MSVTCLTKIPRTRFQTQKVERKVVATMTHPNTVHEPPAAMNGLTMDSPQARPPTVLSIWVSSARGMEEKYSWASRSSGLSSSSCFPTRGVSHTEKVRQTSPTKMMAEMTCSQSPRIARKMMISGLLTLTTFQRRIRRISRSVVRADSTRTSKVVPSSPRSGRITLAIMSAMRMITSMTSHPCFQRGTVVSAMARRATSTAKHAEQDTSTTFA